MNTNDRSAPISRLKNMLGNPKPSTVEKQLIRDLSILEYHCFAGCLLAGVVELKTDFGSRYFWYTRSHGYLRSGSQDGTPIFTFEDYRDLSHRGRRQIGWCGEIPPYGVVDDSSWIDATALTEARHGLCPHMLAEFDIGISFEDMDCTIVSSSSVLPLDWVDQDASGEFVKTKVQLNKIFFKLKMFQNSRGVRNVHIFRPYQKQWWTDEVEPLLALYGCASNQWMFSDHGRQLYSNKQPLLLTSPWQRYLAVKYQSKISGVINQYAIQIAIDRNERAPEDDLAATAWIH